MAVPTSFTIAVTDHRPHDLRFQTEWNDKERRLTIREATFTATNDDEPVRMASIIRVAVGEIAGRAMEEQVLGERGWEGVVADHPDDDPIRCTVDRRHSQGPHWTHGRSVAHTVEDHSVARLCAFPHASP